LKGKKKIDVNTNIVSVEILGKEHKRKKKSDHKES